MSLISEQLPNLMNGVSQQAITMRMSSQGQAQLNGLSSLVSGNKKRPQTQHIAKLKTGTAGGAYIHTINRDATEQYTVLVESGTMQVFDMDGTEKTVTYPDGTGYLTSADPRADFRAITVADYTFFVNRSVDVAKTAELSPDNGHGSLLFIKSVAYETTYKVVVNDVERASYTTVTTASGSALILNDVVDALTTQLTTNLGATYTVSSYGPLVYLKRVDEAYYSLEITDDDGNDRVDVIRGVGGVQRFTDLPATGRADFVVTITGDDQSAFDEYFLKFVPNNPALTFDDGVWEETVIPFQEYKLDASTMPHVLVRMPDGTFEFRQETWADRTVGDDNSAPFPSFVGASITDVYFDRRRLCFLSGDNVIMSQVGNFFNFFPTTVLQILDDGRIDISTTGTEVSTLNYAEAFNQKILLFSDQAQFVIDTDALLASSPPAIKKVSSYESSATAPPVSAGRTLFYAVDRGDWAGVLEYYVMPDSDTTDAADITEHVPRYIPATVVDMAASSAADIVVALSSAALNCLWIYKHHWQGDKKLQSSWSEWRVSDTASIRNIAFIRDRLYLVVDYADGVYLEAVNVGDSRFDVGEDYICRLDRRVSEELFTNVSYDFPSDTTSLTIPYQPHGHSLTVVTRNAGGTSDRPAAVAVPVVSGVDAGTGHTVTLEGDYTATKLYVGMTYSHEYTFSEATLKTSSGSGGVATALAGRLQILRWLFHVVDTGYVRAEVRAYNDAGVTEPKAIKQFTGNALGSSKGIIGELPLRSGVVAFRVNSRSEAAHLTLVNDSFLPSAYSAAEWEGRFSRNTSRV